MLRLTALLLLASCATPRDILAPSVRVEGAWATGSGTLISPTRALTAAHVVKGSEWATLPEYGAVRVVARSEDLDLAMLELSSPASAWAHIARVPGRMFQDVYLVGCPVGYDPVPTRGEIIDVDHDGLWMISAPGYLGNSGGGVFDAETGDLIGVYLMLYGVGGTLITHLGVVMPIARAEGWLLNYDP